MCREVLGIDSNGRRLSDGLQLFNLDVDWGPESIQGVVEKSMKLDMEIMAKEVEIMSKQVDMNSIVSALTDRVIALQGTVDDIAVKIDMDPGQPRENDSKPKKSKKAKQAKPEISEEDLFTRNLLAVEEVVNDKFDDMKNQVKSMEGKVESIDGKVGSVKRQVKSMEGKVESIDAKVGSIEGKIESIEGKVESIEKTMEELKDMISQLMMKGADVA